MRTPIQDVLGHLTKRGSMPKKSVSGWSARCPAHDDQNPSLSISIGDEQQVLLKCHAGCEVTAVLAALGLELRDLYPPEPKREIEATYDYCDESGQLLYQGVRYKPKDFAVRRPQEGEGWIWDVKGLGKVAYHLPDLIKAMRERSAGERVAYVVEGEKDADRLWALGFPATTNVGGAGKWTDQYSRQLKSASVEQVVIIPDNDHAGEAHAQQVAASLIRSGIACKIIRLPGLPPTKPKHGEDVSDWLDLGHIAYELAATVEAAETYHAVGGPLGGLRLVSMGQLLEEPETETEWLVDGLLPAGGVSIVVSKPKVGKTTLVRAGALCVGRGLPWLGRQTKQGPVVYFALEEKRSQVRAHFRHMGARAGDPIHAHIAAMPEDALPELEAVVRDLKPALVIIDTFIRFARLKDVNDYAAVSLALEPLINLARESGAHILLVHHEGKTERPMGDGILGSTALLASVDTALILKRREKYRTICSIQRYGDDMPDTVLKLDPETGCVSAEGAPEAADRDLMAKAMLNEMKGLAEPAEEKVILGLVEGRKTVKEKTLRELVKDKVVTRTGGGKKGNPFVYKLSEILLPATTREGERQIEETDPQASDIELDSPSEDSDHSEPASESREGESRQEKPDQFLGPVSEMLPPTHSGEGENRNSDTAATSSDHEEYSPSQELTMEEAGQISPEGESDSVLDIPQVLGEFEILPPEVLGENGIEDYCLSAEPEGADSTAPKSVNGVAKRRPCRLCGGMWFWRGAHGQEACETCHPPANGEVTEWLVAQP